MVKQIAHLSMFTTELHRHVIISSYVYVIVIQILQSDEVSNQQVV